MKELRDCYRGDSLFELYRFIVSECEDVNAYGVFLFLFDNEYEVRRFTRDEDAPEPTIMDRICDAEVNEAITGIPGLLDVSDMIMKPREKGGKPAIKDYAPEDLLKYQIENEGAEGDQGE